MVYAVDINHFGTPTICEFSIYGGLDHFNFPVFFSLSSHLGSNFPVVGTDNQTMSRTWKILDDNLLAYAVFCTPL